LRAIRTSVPLIFKLLTAIGIVGHKASPPPLVIYWTQRVWGKCEINL
jgi:hypothetical protein